LSTYFAALRILQNKRILKFLGKRTTTLSRNLDEQGVLRIFKIDRRLRFGNVVHAFSTYESRRAQADAQPFARGINSIQLYHDGTRWWVMTLMWDSERPDNPIPAKYLKRDGD